MVPCETLYTINRADRFNTQDRISPLFHVKRYPQVNVSIEYLYTNMYATCVTRETLSTSDLTFLLLYTVS